MNTTPLRKYAPKARQDFLRAVADTARKYGISSDKLEPVTVQGDYAIIAGKSFPRIVAEQRRNIDKRISLHGLDSVIEEVAYTWFNRFMAIRYMELHDYLPHGFRVLSHPEGKDRPEILEKAEYVDLPGLDRSEVIALKLDGTQDEALYRMLLLAQCHAMHNAMPFLFEKIDDQTELLLPDNLLASDSVIRKMVDEIAEGEWERIEVIGWLYQFYISDKKDQVIGKVVKSEDIPAATQLFTPNWIVKYMVQNSLGRKWMATYPNSSLKAKMEYYIEPAEQTPEVQAHLDEITPKELNPEELTLIDPACGSGHILCEAYDLFKELYLERGYRLRDIPRLILEKNLYGLDIDDRAAQMAGFALLMKAREDDRRILDNPPKLNVLALQSSEGLNAQAISDALLSDKPNIHKEQNIRDLLNLFANAKTLGSLLTVPFAVANSLSVLRSLVANHQHLDILKQQYIEDLECFILQADILARHYDVSVMNPPYMGNRRMNVELRNFAGQAFPKSKYNLFAMFIERGFDFIKKNGYNALVTMENWMFLYSYEALREDILTTRCLEGMVHMANGVMGIYSGTSATIFRKADISKYNGTYSYISNEDVKEYGYPITFPVQDSRYSITKQDDFNKIPGSPIAYWVSSNIREVFQNKKVFNISVSGGQNKTNNNDKYVRMIWELDSKTLGVGKKWLLCANGGSFRRWYGNLEHAIDWSETARENYRQGLIAPHLWNRIGITCTHMTSSPRSFCVLPNHATCSTGGPSIFLQNDEDILYMLAFLNSCVSEHLLKILNSTLPLEIKNVRDLPYLVSPKRAINEALADQLLIISKQDWDSFETSMDFQKIPFPIDINLEASINSWDLYITFQRERMKKLEEENNCLFIETYGLQDELTPEVNDEQITLARADRDQDIRRLLSYAIGCMMGRYSLDEPGLIYAHSGNQDFDAERYASFPADNDGILPMTDMDWFGKEDTANRIAEFIQVAWPPESLDENLKFVADSLGPKAAEVPIETIRRYLCTSFYKDHLQTYKRRPIYWLFSSGKKRAFQALVYLHRYNEGTLARMRMDYVVPLQSRMSARIDQLKDDIEASISTADRRKREKEREKLIKQLAELRLFDEKLRYVADQRISIDLDDGVKVNYGKFGDLLAEVKAVTGGSEE